MNIFKAILLKLASALFFAGLGAQVRYLGTETPVGQVVFFRSAFAILPVLLMLAWRNELRAAVYTRRPWGHVGRGAIGVFAMFMNFSAIARLPLADATAISVAAPLITVAFAAIFLGEHVRMHRWSAVVVGFIGVLIMLLPHFEPDRLSGADLVTAIGATCALIAAFANSGAVIQTRRLTSTETTASIVFYFSLICALAGLLTLPFGWIMPDAASLAALIGSGLFGGIAHILLTESYRYAPASVIAPFDYSTMLWALLLGFVLFGELPALSVYVGSVIVAGAGIYVIWRERERGLKRVREVEGVRAGV